VLTIKKGKKCHQANLFFFQNAVPTEKHFGPPKQAGGTGETEKGKQPAAQKKRTRTTRQATQTQPALLAADAPFAAALEAIPAEDWCRTWAAGRTIMLRRTSKRVKEVVGKMRLPAVVRLSRSFWGDARNGTAAEKLQIVMRQLTLMTAFCRISTLELSSCDMKGQDAERLAGVLTQCPALAHLDLGRNYNFGSAGAERLAGVLGQCRELVHLNLSINWIGTGGAERLAAVLPQCAALAHLNLSHNNIEATGAKSLAGVLGQCRNLVHLNLMGNQIGNAGAERLAGVLAHCTSLAHLYLHSNDIGTVGKGRLRDSWRGEASGLVL
jgi:Ran GTPase-activating protein (RanGAP) involved in mRNA processing and transport